MIKTQLLGDKFSVGLSIGCLVHCLFFPTFLIAISSFITFSYHEELVHLVILLFAVPISIFSLYLGLNNHRKYSGFVIGLIGLSLLILAVYLGVTVLGDLGEKYMTIFGSILVFFAHLRNYQICKNLLCKCHDKKK